jgi:hypothetical protein
MPSVVYNEFKRANAAGEIDLNADDIRVALVMTNSTCPTQNDGVTTLSGFTTVDEMNGANYARKALANEAVNKDDANDRAEFDADDVVWTSLGAGTRSIAGVLVYKHVTNDADSIPIAYLEFPSPVVADGNNFTITWHAEGILQLA